MENRNELNVANLAEGTVGVNTLDKTIAHQTSQSSIQQVDMLHEKESTQRLLPYINSRSTIQPARVIERSVDNENPAQVLLNRKFNLYGKYGKKYRTNNNSKTRNGGDTDLTPNSLRQLPHQQSAKVLANQRSSHKKDKWRVKAHLEGDLNESATMSKNDSFKDLLIVPSEPILKLMCEESPTKSQRHVVYQRPGHNKPNQNFQFQSSSNMHAGSNVQSRKIIGENTDNYDSKGKLDHVESGLMSS